MYLERDFGSRMYWATLTEALLKTNSAYGFAIAALRQRDGLVPEKHFQIVCGAPIKQKKHLSPDTIFTRLSEAGLLKKIAVPGLGDCITLVQADGYYDNKAQALRVRLITENILLCAIKDWLKKLGITSYDKTATRDQEALPKVGTLYPVAVKPIATLLTKSTASFPTSNGLPA